MGVGQALRFHVARLVEELLNEALATAERRDGFAHCGLVLFGDFFDRAGDLEATTATAEDSLDGYGQAVLLSEGNDFVGVLDGILQTWSQRCASSESDLLGLGLIAQSVDRGRRWADPDQARIEYSLSKVGVLGEEAVTRVNRVGATAFSDRQNLRNIEVGVGRCGALQGVSLVGETHIERIAIGFSVDGNATDAGVLRGTHHAYGDFATVSNQNLL